MLHAAPGDLLLRNVADVGKGQAAGQQTAGCCHRLAVASAAAGAGSLGAGGGDQSSAAAASAWAPRHSSDSVNYCETNSLSCRLPMIRAEIECGDGPLPQCHCCHVLVSATN